jgi:hypothetical protein
MARPDTANESPLVAALRFQMADRHGQQRSQTVDISEASSIYFK